MSASHVHLREPPRQEKPARQAPHGPANRREAIGVAPRFVNPAGRSTDKRWVANAVTRTGNRAARSVGLAGVKNYEGTKHSAASAVFDDGMPLDQIQGACGHADVKSTRRYAKRSRVPSLASPVVPSSYLAPQKVGSVVLPLLPKIRGSARDSGNCPNEKDGVSDGDRTRSTRATSLRSLRLSDDPPAVSLVPSSYPRLARRPVSSYQGKGPRETG